MKACLLFYICAILIACSQIDGDADVAKNNNDPKKSIVLDPSYSDLLDLPVDEGGEHTPHLLTSESNAGYGYYAYMPGGYEENELAYPLLLFLHGSGEIGVQGFPELLDKVLVNGPPMLIESENWKPRFPSLVVSPQSQGFWSAESIQRFIDYLIENYRVNTQRIYITGLSMGGRGCWEYEGKMGDDSYAAALVPICGWGEPAYGENLVYAPIWAFHGAEDSVVKPFDNNGSFQMVQVINDKNPKFKAKLTIYPDVGHNSWEQTYDSSGMGTESANYDPFDMNVYDWLFQFRLE